jgi:hypothetical protein
MAVSNNAPNPRVVLSLLDGGTQLPTNTISSILAEEVKAGKWDTLDASGYDVNFIITADTWPELHPQFIWILEEFKSFLRPIFELYISLADREYTDDELSLIGKSSGRILTFITNQISFGNISRLQALAPRKVYITYQAVGQTLTDANPSRERYDSITFNKIAQVGGPKLFQDTCIPQVCTTYFLQANESMYFLCSGPTPGKPAIGRYTPGSFYGSFWQSGSIARIQEMRDTGTCPFCGKKTVHPIIAPPTFVPPTIEVGPMTTGGVLP